MTKNRETHGKTVRVGRSAVFFKSCIFMVNMNLNKTILQSLYIIFRLFLLFSQEVPTTQPKYKLETVYSLTIYKRSTICLKL